MGERRGGEVPGLPLPDSLAQVLWSIYSVIMFPALFYELVVDLMLHNPWAFVLTAPLFGAIIWYHWIMVNVWSRLLGKLTPVEEIDFRSGSWLVRYVFINRATIIMALYTIAGAVMKGTAGVPQYAICIPLLGMLSAWFWGLIIALMLDLEDLPHIPYFRYARDTETELYRIIVGVVLLVALLLPPSHYIPGWLVPVLWAEAIASLVCGILFAVWGINVADLGLVPAITYLIRGLIANAMLIDPEDFMDIEVM